MSENSKSSFPLGELWYRKFYHSIIGSLHLSEAADVKSRDLLSSMLDELNPRIDLMESIVERYRSRNAVVFGAGPSLESDIVGMKEFLCSKPVIVAADGATDALVASGVSPDFVVSDLDSCSETQLIEQSKSSALFVHSHGDNTGLISKVVPKLGPNVYGTTQVCSIINVKNVGGFTDGDRACYLAANLDPPILVVSGMDFGSKEGRYSRARENQPVGPPSAGFRSRKLEWGKKSLEFLIASKPSSRFYNVTKYGEEIEGTARISYSELSSATSKPL